MKEGGKEGRKVERKEGRKEDSTNNKNPETDVGVQPEDQKSKIASHWL